MRETQINRYTSSTGRIEALERRTLCAVVTSTTVSAVPSVELGQDLVVKTLVKQTKGAYSPHGAVELFNGTTTTGLKGRVDHLGRFYFKFTAKDSPFIGTYSFNVRYAGAAGKFAVSRSKSTTVVVTDPEIDTDYPDGLSTATVKQGTGTQVVHDGDEVQFEYTGYKTDGTLASRSIDHGDGTVSFVVDSTNDHDLAGVDEALVGMKVGETRVAVIPSALAYEDDDFYIFILKVDAIS